LQADDVGILCFDLPRELPGFERSQPQIVSHDAHISLTGTQRVEFEAHQRPSPEQERRAAEQRQLWPPVAKRQNAANEGHSAPAVLRKIGE